jgi:hypothetical protein
MPKTFLTFVHLNLVAAIAFVVASPAPSHEFRYTAKLTGPAESPSNSSPATGSALVTLDLDLITMRVQTDFAGLQGFVTAAHIHAPTTVAGAGIAGVATQVPTFSGFPAGVTSGSYDHTFDLALASSYNQAFITSSGGTISDALNALIFALNDGKAYLNIHTSAFSTGEIRGFLSYVPGDFNVNGSVDAADYVLWAKTKGAGGDGLPADANNDFVVDDLDYDIWRQNFANFGLSTPPGSGSALSSNIPEPGAVALLAIALLSQFRLRLINGRLQSEHSFRYRR